MHIHFYFSILLEDLTVYGHPEHEEWHAVELPAPADTKAEAAIAPPQLHGKVLVLLPGKMGANLVILLYQVQVKQV